MSLALRPAASLNASPPHLEGDFLRAWLVRDEAFAHVAAGVKRCNHVVSELREFRAALDQSHSPRVVELLVALVVVVLAVLDLELARRELAIAGSTPEAVRVVRLAIHVDASSKPAPSNLLVSQQSNSPLSNAPAPT